MIKKKAKHKKAAKKSRKKNGEKLDPAKVRQEIAGIVKAGAGMITDAVMDKAVHGELAPAKFLLEMAGVYPVSADGSLSTDDESLAKTLLDRLNIPDSPVVHDLYERGEDVIVIQPDAAKEKEGEDGKVDEVRVGTE